MSLVRRLVDEWRDGSNRFDRPGEAVFGAWVEGRLVGVCGLNIDPYVRDERMGRVRHLYVLTACRRHGVGRLLMARVIEAACGTSVIRPVPRVGSALSDRSSRCSASAVSPAMSWVVASANVPSME